ncbi:MAG: serine hydrolase domain-containing protein [Cyclobacteriaceae bacterium]|jgi:CubicO group peptidase (beta-lactamase class C family)|nr:beta-lactamase family protein [Flammeovirgaceae bacterium]
MKLFLVCIAILISNRATAQDAIDKYILAQMEKEKMVGLSVGVIKNGQIVKAKGYGKANVELGVAASENTVYKLASVSKQIIATAIMKMVEERKISLQDPISKFFKDAPGHWNKITVRHLLNHTSGLQRESPAFEAMAEKPDSVLIKEAYKDSLAFPTGTKWQYCNLGYFMLADIIRIKTGQPFASYMREEIFVKHGLSNTQTTSVKSIIPNRADGYVTTKGTLFNAEDYIALRPSGAFVSTITDLLKWEKLLQQNKILTESSLNQMWNDKVTTPAVSGNGEVIYYGYGWRIARYLNKDVVFHTGVLPGFRAIFYRIPAEKTTIIILANSELQDIIKTAEGLAELSLANLEKAK